MPKYYKGFDNNLKCRDFQYEVGKEYEEEKADICKTGFHACENPLDVFNYYNPANSRFCEVEIDEASGEKSGDSKVCGKKIRIGAEIGIKGLVEGFVKFVFEKVDFVNAKESNTGYQSAATNTGNYSAATNTGYQSAATNTGNYSAATNTGNYSAATNTGNYSAATNTGGESAATCEGKESIAIATGYRSKAKGAFGCWLILAEWEILNNERHIVNIKSVKVDGKKIKADMFYMLVDGKFKEAE